MVSVREDEEFLIEGDEETDLRNLERSLSLSTEENKRKVAQLVEVLKLVEDPEPLILELLHTICQKYQEAKYGDMDSVLVSCSPHPAGHKLVTEGFQLLEFVEGTMGTTLQKVEELEYGCFNENITSSFSLASALMARIGRQKEPLQKVTMNSVLLLANTGITATLLQNTQEWIIEGLYLQRDFGEEGWSWLAEGLKQKDRGAVEQVWLSKKVMGRAKKEDFKAV